MWEVTMDMRKSLFLATECSPARVVVYETTSVVVHKRTQKVVWSWTSVQQCPCPGSGLHVYGPRSLNTSRGMECPWAPSLDQVTIYTDASLLGWGTIMRWHVTWKWKRCGWLYSTSPLPRDHHVLIMKDSMTAKPYINRQDGLRSTQCMDWARRMDVGIHLNLPWYTT